MSHHYTTNNLLCPSINNARCRILLRLCAFKGDPKNKIASLRGWSWVQSVIRFNKAGDFITSKCLTCTTANFETTLQIVSSCKRRSKKLNESALLKKAIPMKQVSLRLPSTFVVKTLHRLLLGALAFGSAVPQAQTSDLFLWIFLNECDYLISWKMPMFFSITLNEQASNK